MVRRSSDWAVRIDRAFLMESLQHCCDEKVSITGEKMPLQWGRDLRIRNHLLVVASIVLSAGAVGGCSAASQRYSGMGTGHVTDRANANATSPVNSGNVPINLASLSPTGIPTTTDKKQVFTEIWNLFNENYPNFEMKGVDWSTERIKYESKAIDAGTWPQFFQLLTQ